MNVNRWNSIAIWLYRLTMLWFVQRAVHLLAVSCDRLLAISLYLHDLPVVH